MNVIHYSIIDPNGTTIEDNDNGIYIVESGGQETFIRDDECDTPEKMLSWFLYFYPRGWVTKEFLCEFVRHQIIRQKMNVEEPLL